MLEKDNAENFTESIADPCLSYMISLGFARKSLTFEVKYDDRRQLRCLLFLRNDTTSPLFELKALIRV